ncbi:hypothetical protein [Singulisphaera acidiphila]|uniref:hypothetical protein n=1 Tax=Singulisphaera acidiphila TaxID=466153 RepID=UPI000373EEF5|nr:hypothetical protein [Singulisphaera acidiphila]
MAEHATARPEEIVDLIDFTEGVVGTIVRALGRVTDVREALLRAKGRPCHVTGEGFEPLTKLPPSHMVKVVGRGGLLLDLFESSGEGTHFSKDQVKTAAQIHQTMVHEMFQRGGSPIQLIEPLTQAPPTDEP